MAGPSVSIVYQCDYDGAAGTIAEIAVNSLLVSAGTTNPALVEIGTLGFMGLKMAALGDDVRHVMPVPSNWDRHQDIRVRAIWATESVTTADRVVWKFLYDELTPDVTELVAPATALDTVIAADAPIATAKTLLRSPAGIINAKSIADTELYWSFLLESDAQTGNPLTDGVYLLGVEFEFSPKHGPGELEAEAIPWQAD